MCVRTGPSAEAAGTLDDDDDDDDDDDAPLSMIQLSSSKVLVHLYSPFAFALPLKVASAAGFFLLAVFSLGPVSTVNYMRTIPLPFRLARL